MAELTEERLYAAGALFVLALHTTQVIWVESSILNLACQAILLDQNE